MAIFTLFIFIGSNNKDNDQMKRQLDDANSKTSNLTTQLEKVKISIFFLGGGW